MDICFLNFIFAGIVLTSAALSSAFASSGEVRMSFTDLPYNFTLSAWNTTLPNVNETGVPLVLGQNGKISTFFGWLGFHIVTTAFSSVGASTGMSFQVTSTYASYPYDDFPFMSLNNGSLRAYLPSGFWMTNATTPRSGSPLEWVSSTLYSRPAATVFSVEHAPAGRFPMLAAYGRVDLWSLCPFQGFRGQTSVVCDAEKDDGIPPSSIGFDVKDCYAVKIYVIAAV